MGQIDFTQVVTASTRAARSKDMLSREIRDACDRRIESVLDERMNLHIQGAALAGLLDPAQMAAFRAGQIWLRDMRSVCRRSIAEEARPDWPDPPKELGELAASY